jgi:hypothetical protein
MQRRPIVVAPRRRGRGILGTIARTAIIAGTATATSRAVSGTMSASARRRQQEQAADAAAFQAQAAIQSAAPSAAPSGEDVIAQLQQLAQLKEAGALSDDEFQAAKANLLGM